MRELKYIKLFEAFESIKLSKTLKFLKGENKRTFLVNLKAISDKIDFPFSKFNDDYFEYLPFKSALNKNYIIDETKEECKHESDWIPGEFCEGGRIKRTWGKGIRTVTCPHCDGTGFNISRSKPKLKYIKFWFDKDGNYITTTGNNGEKVQQSYLMQIGPELKGFSKNINDYKVEGGQISVDTLKNLPAGTLVKFGDSIAMVFKEDRSPNRVYMLQDVYGGSDPDYTSRDIWQQYAQYSWVVGVYGDMKPTYMLQGKSHQEDDSMIPYSYNNVINTRNLSLQSSRNMAEVLRNAHFAIILDFEKLNESEFEKSSKISDKRKEMIKGTYALRKPQDIKSENLDKYLKELVNRFDAAKGIEELTKVVPRAMGRNNSLMFIISGYNLNSLDNLCKNVYQVIDHPDKAEYYAGDIKYYISEIYNRSSQYNKIINTNIQKFYIDYNNVKDRYSDDINEQRIRIFDEMIKLGEVINKRILSQKIENLADMELLLSKIKSIKSIFERFSYLSNFKYVINYLTKEGYNAANELIEDIHPNDFNRFFKELEQFKIVIEKI